MHATPRLFAGFVLLFLGAAACSSSGASSTDSAGARPPSTAVATTSTAMGRGPTAMVPINTVGTSPANERGAVAASVLPVPDGPFSVGVVDLPLPQAIAYFPAQANTGTGQHPYLDAELLASSGLPVEPFSALMTSARIGAVALAGNAPRPVVVLAPGFGSLIALSTSLAEHLASHG